MYSRVPSPQPRSHGFSPPRWRRARKDPGIGWSRDFQYPENLSVINVFQSCKIAVVVLLLREPGLELVCWGKCPDCWQILEFSPKFFTPNKMLYYYTQLFWVENHVISRCHVFSRLPSTWRRKALGKSFHFLGVWCRCIRWRISFLGKLSRMVLSGFSYLALHDCIHYSLQ